MVKMVVVFLALWAVIVFGIQTLGQMNATQKLSLVKASAFGLICATLASLILFIIVALF